MDIAKLFWSGRSQAVRLPKNFRFENDKVRIRKHGNAVILEPIAEDWSWLENITRELDSDFIQAVKEKPKEENRPALERFFK